MAGITDAKFLNTVIPYGFNVATLGGFNLDAPTINASKQIIERGRKEFHFPLNTIFSHIQNEVNLIKNEHSDVKVSVNVRATSPEHIIKLDEIDNLDIIEINCHCRQEEFLEINCGQNMLKRHDLEDFIKTVCENVSKKVSVKIRAGVVDNLEVAKTIEKAGADYLHIDAMKLGIFDADYDVLKNLCNECTIPIIGNNSVNCEENLEKMLATGVSGFSIARAVIGGMLDFEI